MNIIALIEQQHLRDLGRLMELSGAVTWLPRENLADSPEPAVLCAMLAAGDPEGTARLLAARSAAGAATILVPRFKAGDLSAVIGAPAPAVVKPGEFAALTWEDGVHYPVPGVCWIESALHAGRWAIADGLGPVVRCFRPHHSAGPIVLCTANLAGRPLGVDPAVQKAFFERLMAAVHSLSGVVDFAQPDQKEVPAADLSAFLDQTRENGVAILLTLFVFGCGREDLPAAAREHLNIDLPEAVWKHCLACMPTGISPVGIEQILGARGWSAHLRRIRQIKTDLLTTDREET